MILNLIFFSCLRLLHSAPGFYSAHAFNSFSLCVGPRAKADNRGGLTNSLTSTYIY